MKYIFAFIGVLLYACNHDTNSNTPDESSSGGSSSLTNYSSSSVGISEVFRLWVGEQNFGKIGFGFDNIVADSVWLSTQVIGINQSELLWKARMIYCSSCPIQPALYGNIQLPDSTFLRGDTIRYRIGYMLDGKVDSTEWQTYVFLGNHVSYRIKDSTHIIQQFDSLQYPITLGPKDSCGVALLAFAVTYSDLDTFDYESNWSSIFADGRTYKSTYDIYCLGEKFPPTGGTLDLMSYEGDINEAAKAIQKINPVFFLNLVPFCEEYTPCVIPTPQ